MYPFKEYLQSRQKNISSWVNTCEYIILHHTWAIWDWNIKVLLWETSRKVSAHILVRQNWDALKLAEPNWVTWHAWVSEWKWKGNMNNFSIWIEVEWPWFTDAQRRTVFWLTQHLMGVFNIPKENVIRHKDVSPWRKFDISDDFFENWYIAWRDKLKPRPFN